MKNWTNAFASRFARGLSVWMLCFMLLGTQPSNASERIVTLITFFPDYDGRPLVRIALTPSIKATFLIDTGSESLISERVVKRMGIRPEMMLDAENRILQEDGKPMKRVILNGVHIGDQNFKLPLRVIQPYRLTSDRFDGIIGFDILKQYAVQFDFTLHQMRWFGGGKLAPNELDEAGMQASIAVPQANPPNDSFAVSTQLNDKVAADLTIDTGSQMTVISAALSRQLKLEPTYKPTNKITSQGRAEFDAVTLHSLALGTLVHMNIPVIYPHDPRSKITLCLGLDILQKYQVLIDYPQQMIYFKPVKADVASDVFSMDANQTFRPHSAHEQFIWQFQYKNGQKYETQTQTRVDYHSPNELPQRASAMVRSRHEVSFVTNNGDATIVTFVGKVASSDPESPQLAMPPSNTRVFSRTGQLIEETSGTSSRKQPMDVIFSIIQNTPVPPHSVETGESWETLLQNPFLKGKMVVLHSTFKGIEATTSGDTYCVHVSMAVPQNENATHIILIEGTYNVHISEWQITKSTYRLQNVEIATPLGRVNTTIIIGQVRM